MQHQTPHKSRLKLLAIGFLPPPLGGVSVSFKTFCDIVAGQGEVHLDVINLSGASREGAYLRNAIILAKRIWARSGACDVVTLYCATPQVATIGLLTLVLCRLRRKPFILRKAASLDYLALNGLSRWIAAYVVKRVDLFLAETKQLTQLCLERGISHAKWFPTNRSMGPLIESRQECRRFVYIGQVRPSKGVLDLIAAALRLPEGASIDVYGPFFDDLADTVFSGHNRIKYKGILQPEEVITQLRHYDAFVLPSKAVSEGYPGAILEAFSVGLPVISTTVGGIPEIVDERSGILVKPGDLEALICAMLRFIEDRELYRSLCLGALEARERYSSEYWTQWLVRECLALGTAT